ncbi:MAG: hypothetical protein M1819_007374 [Sarea resinae]|nr:MAG: hypothetical protein M1819_007374 [Sarea resinae]
MPHFKILIIGAGVAGLSAAISLRRQGHTITVLERHPGCQALGGSVGISANATRVLIDYGMGEIMAKKDARGSNTVHQRRYDTGEILGSRTNDQTVQTYGYPGWTLARYRLQETLAQVAEQRGVTILFSRLVVGVDQDRPAVELKDGTIIEGDLIIGADVLNHAALAYFSGIRSILRNAVEGGEPIKSISPFSAYNIDIPRSLLAADPSLSHLLDESNFWLGPSQIVVGINMPDHGDKMNLCLVSEEQEGKEGEWYLHGDLERVKAKYAHFAPSVRKMLDLAKPEDTYIWR